MNHANNPLPELSVKEIAGCENKSPQVIEYRCDQSQAIWIMLAAAFFGALGLFVGGGYMFVLVAMAMAMIVYGLWRAFDSSTKIRIDDKKIADLRWIGSEVLWSDVAEVWQRKITKGASQQFFIEFHLNSGKRKSVRIDGLDRPIHEIIAEIDGRIRNWFLSGSSVE